MRLRPFLGADLSTAQAPTGVVVDPQGKNNSELSVPQWEAKINDVAKQSTLFMYELQTWAKFVCILYILFLVSLVIVVPLQERNGTVNNNRRLATPIM